MTLIYIVRYILGITSRNFLYFLMAAAVLCLAASSSEAVTYTYDGNDRLTFVMPQDGNGMEYSYDPVGNRLATNSQTASLSGLTISPATHDFSNAFIDRISLAQTFTVTNPGASSVNINSVSISRGKSEFFLQNDQCSGVTLPPQGACSFEAYIKPLSIGEKSALVSVTSDDSVSPLLNMPLSGTGVYAPIISTSPTSLSFGQILVGSQTSRALTVSNTGLVDLIINGVSLTDNINFSIAYDVCSGAALGIGETCIIDVDFMPQSTGYKSGFLNISSNRPEGLLPVSVSGMGELPYLEVEPLSYDFGVRDINYSNYVYKTFIVRNVSTRPLSLLAGLGLSDNTNYGISGNGCRYVYDPLFGPTMYHPVTLDPGEWCGVAVRFKPISPGIKNATLSISTSDWVNPIKTVSLTGTGSTLRYRRLSVSINGNDHRFQGNGNVVSSPSGIDCGAGCWADYLFDTVVTLTAQPAEGSFFAQWLNINCREGSHSPICTTTIRLDTYAVAGFIISQQSSSSVTSLDLAVAVDTTGSMWDSMDKVKSNQHKVVDSIGSAISDYRIALIGYRDHPERPGQTADYPYHVILPFSSDRAAIHRAIDSLSVGGGGDKSEAVDEALMKTIVAEGTGGWRSGVKKVVLLVGDAPPHDYELMGDSLNYIWEIGQSAEPITIYGMVMGGDTQARDYFSLISELTGGRLFDLSQTNSIIPELLGSHPEFSVIGSPNCNAAYASAAQLWPVDHSMRSVNILNVLEPDGSPAYVSIIGISQDEPVADVNNFIPDGYGVGTDTAWLRAERDGSGNGRVYKITFTAAGRYGQCEGSLLVCAPHDKGDNSVCIDDGQYYDSIQP